MDLFRFIRTFRVNMEGGTAIEEKAAPPPSRTVADAVAETSALSAVAPSPVLPATERTAMAVATVFSCVKLLQDSVASLPLEVMRRSGPVFVPHTASRLHHLLTVEPNPRDNIFDFLSAAIGEMLLAGNAYIIPVRDHWTDPEPERLVLCNRGAVSIDHTGTVYTVNDPGQDIFGVYDVSEVIHLKNIVAGRDKRYGLSTLRYAAQCIGTASAGDRETGTRFASGGIVGGIVSNGAVTRGFGEYQDSELQHAATDLDYQYNTLGRRIVSVPGSVDFKQLSMSSADLQFLETRKFTVLDICRFFRVPPQLIFADTAGNYKSSEMANSAFLTNTLNPILRKIEIEMHRKLFSPETGSRRRLRFDRQQLHAADLSTRVKYQLTSIQAGLMTVNEWRLAENRPPVEGGDRILVSANMKSIEELTSSAPADTNNDDKTE